MNTQLSIKDELINKVMRIAGQNTPQKAVIFALEKILTHKDSLSQAFGKYPWEGDLDAMREIINR